MLIIFDDICHPVQELEVVHHTAEMLSKQYRSKKLFYVADRLDIATKPRLCSLSTSPPGKPN